jgi:ketosteroid isomerase-like protein
MSEQDVQVVRSMYENFNKGDIPGVLANCDPEVAWTEPGGGNSPSGTFNGTDSVAQDVFSKIPENFDEFEAAPEDFNDENGTVVVKGQFKGKNKSGAELDSAFEHTFELQDGKVVKLENKVDAEAWTAAWS